MSLAQSPANMFVGRNMLSFSGVFLDSTEGGVSALEKKHHGSDDSGVNSVW